MKRMRCGYFSSSVDVALARIKLPAAFNLPRHNEVKQLACSTGQPGKYLGQHATRINISRGTCWESVLSLKRLAVRP